MNSSNKVSGLLLSTVGLYLLGFSFSYNTGHDVGAGVFPSVIGIGLLLLGAALAWKKDHHATPIFNSSSELIRVVKVVGSVTGALLVTAFLASLI